MVTAKLSDYRQSPRKVRLLADLVRGKRVDRALALLQFSDKRASGPVEKLLKSAVANAVANFGFDRDTLFVKEIRVDKGMTLKRINPGAHGRGYRINKRSSHIFVSLDQKPLKKEKPASAEVPSAPVAEKSEKPKRARAPKKKAD